MAVRIPLVAGGAGTLNACVQGGFAIFLGEPLAGSLFLVTALIYGGATVYYYRTGDARSGVRVLLWASLANNIGIHIALGGFVWSGMSLGWGILVTTSSALFLGRRPTILLGSSYAFAAVVLVFLEPALRATREAPAAAVSAILGANMFILSLAILVPMTVLLVGQIASEQARANELLFNVLPTVIARRLKETPGVIAEEFDECTVLFADIVGFTRHASEVPPERLVAELNHIFSRFDDLVRAHRAEKIKTIGDGYMAVAGAPVPIPDHVDCICRLALAMAAEMSHINEVLGTSFKLRVGINTGSVVAGVIGASRFSYDLWGDTVNVASRMESQGRPGSIQVTKAVVDRAGDEFLFEPAGAVQVKGLDEMEVFALVGTIPVNRR